MHKGLKPKRETLDSRILSYISKNHQDNLVKETCSMPAVSEAELSKVNYSNEKENVIIETDTILTLESDLIVLTEIDTENENYKEHKHQYKFSLVSFAALSI